MHTINGIREGFKSAGNTINNLPVIGGLISKVKEELTPPSPKSYDEYMEHLEQRNARVRQQAEYAFSRGEPAPDEREQDETGFMKIAIVLSIMLTASGFGAPFAPIIPILAISLYQAYDSFIMAGHAPQEFTFMDMIFGAEKEVETRTKIKEQIKSPEFVKDRLRDKAIVDPKVLYLLEKHSLQTVELNKQLTGIPPSIAKSIKERQERLSRLQEAKKQDLSWAPFWSRNFSKDRFRHEARELATNLGLGEMRNLMLNGYNLDLSAHMLHSTTMENARQEILTTTNKEDYVKLIKKLNRTTVPNREGENQSILSLVLSMVEVSPRILPSDLRSHDGVYSWGSKDDADKGRYTLDGAIKRQFSELIEEGSRDKHSLHELECAAINEEIDHIYLLGPCTAGTDSDIKTAINSITSKNPELKGKPYHEVFNKDNVYLAFQEAGYSDTANKLVKTNMSLSTVVHEFQHANFHASNFRQKAFKDDKTTDYVQSQFAIRDLLLQNHYKNFLKEFGTAAPDFSSPESLLGFLDFEKDEQNLAGHIARAITKLATDPAYKMEMDGIEYKPGFPNIQDQSLRLLEIAANPYYISDILKQNFMIDRPEIVERLTSRLANFSHTSRATEIFRNTFTIPEQSYSEGQRLDEYPARVAENKSEITNYLKSVQENPTTPEESKKSIEHILKEEKLYKKATKGKLIKKYHNARKRHQNTKHEVLTSQGQHSHGHGHSHSHHCCGRSGTNPRFTQAMAEEARINTMLKQVNDNLEEKINKEKMKNEESGQGKPRAKEILNSPLNIRFQEQLSKLFKDTYKDPSEGPEPQQTATNSKAENANNEMRRRKTQVTTPQEVEVY